MNPIAFIEAAAATRSAVLGAVVDPVARKQFSELPREVRADQQDVLVSVLGRHHRR